MKLDKYLECFEELDENLIDDAAPRYTEKRKLHTRLIISAALVAVMLVLTFLAAYRFGDNRKEGDLPPQTEDSYNHIILPDKNILDNEFETPTTTDTSLLEDKIDTTVNAENDPVADIVDGLPVLTPELAVNGYGFEGMLVYDISELDQNDPFDINIELNNLPVYKNLAYDKHFTAHPISFLSRAELKMIAEAEAHRLGAAILSHNCVIYDQDNRENLGFCDVTDDESITKGIIYYSVETPKFTIKVGSLGNISYIFNYDEMLALPEYLINNKKMVTQEEKRLIVDYIVRTYSEYFPCDKLTGGDTIDYTFSGEYYDYRNKWLHNYYENISNDYVGSILNFNFNKYHFSLNEELTHVVSITVPGDYTAYTEKIGDYPVIGYTEALDRLINGKYLTTVDEKLCLADGKVRRESVHKTEIVYLTSSGNEIFMPYYKFYVLLDWRHEKSPVDLKDYGVFYVPAVSDEYLKMDTVVINGQWGMSNENT